MPEEAILAWVSRNRGPDPALIEEYLSDPAFNEEACEEAGEAGEAAETVADADRRIEMRERVREDLETLQEYWARFEEDGWPYKD